MTRAVAKTAETTDPGLITTKQMRELHAQLREFGITGDAAVHDYVARALEEMGADPIESRKDLTAVQAAHLIADLDAAPPPPTGPSAATLRKLRAPFPPEEVGKLPRSTCRDCSDSPRKRCDRHQWVTACPECRGSHSSATMHIDFVGHADVTSRLLDVDPEWTWRPWTAEELNGIPPAMRTGLWIWLRVCGVERAGFGHAEGDRQKGGDAVKVAIGDALRNAGMRFGIALDLWAKGDRDWSHAAKTEGYGDPPMDPPAPAERTVEHAPSLTAAAPTAEDVLARLEGYRDRYAPATSWEEFSAKFREAHGGITVHDLPAVPVERILQWEASVVRWINENTPVGP